MYMDIGSMGQIFSKSGDHILLLLPSMMVGIFPRMFLPLYVLNAAGILTTTLALHVDDVGEIWFLNSISGPKT